MFSGAAVSSVSSVCRPRLIRIAWLGRVIRLVGQIVLVRIPWLLVFITRKAVEIPIRAVFAENPVDEIVPGLQERRAASCRSIAAKSSRSSSHCPTW